MVLAVDCRAEGARQQAFVPAVPTPTLAMSPVQPVTNALPTHILEAEPISPPTTQKSTEGEYAAELTPDIALVQSIADLTLPEKVSDSEAVMTAVCLRKTMRQQVKPLEKDLDAAQPSKNQAAGGSVRAP